MHLPTKDYDFYVGIDPGFSGAIGMMNRAATSIRVWDMPVRHRGDKDSKRELDLAGLRDLFKRLKKFPRVCVGLEWPTTRPGEGAERSERFGRGKGVLEAYCYLFALDYFKLAPHAWKGRLGLPGKDDPESGPICLTFLERAYPAAGPLCRGPKGGLRDGRMDALLITHFLRECRNLTGTVARHGKGSPEALAALLAWGSNRKNARLRIRENGQ